MSTALRWRVLAVTLGVAGAVALVLTRPARLGLDLQGGTQIVLEARDTDRVKVDGDVASRTLEVLRRRVDALGVAEPTLQRSGDRRIIIELPGVADPDEAVDIIGRTAQLAFHPVLAIDAPLPATESATTTALAAPTGEQLVLEGEGGERLRLGPALVSGEAISGARATLSGDLGAQWQVQGVGVRFREWIEARGRNLLFSLAGGSPSRRRWSS